MASWKRLELTVKKLKKQIVETPDEIKDSIKAAIENVKNFAKAQLASIKELEINNNGVTLGHKVIPLQVVGAYVPGGNYPLPSSAIMTVVPAKAAGVEEVIVCSPRIQPVTIAAAALSGADRIFRIGGVQAVAAMAYGTESVPAVNKIVGPGNKYVTAAKKEVYGVCGIDFLAGPSEVMIIADETANPRFVAADMLVQCEHDADARAYLVSTSEQLAQDVVREISTFLTTLPTSAIAERAIKKA